jgi:hypothetical protein
MREAACCAASERDPDRGPPDGRLRAFGAGFDRTVPAADTTSQHFEYQVCLLRFPTMIEGPGQGNKRFMPLW